MSAIRAAVRNGLVSSAHDVSEGGMAVALAECCIAGGLGATVEVPDLFGEGPTRASISALREDIADLEARLDASMESAEDLPHRRKYLLLVNDYLRGPGRRSGVVSPGVDRQAG